MARGSIEVVWLEDESKLCSFQFKSVKVKWHLIFHPKSLLVLSSLIGRRFRNGPRLCRSDRSLDSWSNGNWERIGWFSTTISMWVDSFIVDSVQPELRGAGGADPQRRRLLLPAEPVAVRLVHHVARGHPPGPLLHLHALAQHQQLHRYPFNFFYFFILFFCSSFFFQRNESIDPYFGSWSIGFSIVREERPVYWSFPSLSLSLSLSLFSFILFLFRFGQWGFIFPWSVPFPREVFFPFFCERKKFEWSHDSKKKKTEQKSNENKEKGRGLCIDWKKRGINYVETEIKKNQRQRNEIIKRRSIMELRK